MAQYPTEVPRINPLIIDYQGTEPYPKSKTLLTTTLTSVFGIAASTLLRSLDMRYDFIGDLAKVTLYAQAASTVASGFGSWLSYKMPDWCCFRCCKANIDIKDRSAGYKVLVIGGMIVVANAVLVPIIIDAYKDKLGTLIIDYVITHASADKTFEMAAVLNLAADAGTTLVTDFIAGGISYPINYFNNNKDSADDRPGNASKFTQFFSRCCGRRPVSLNVESLSEEETAQSSVHLDVDLENSY